MLQPAIRRLFNSLKNSSSSFFSLSKTSYRASIPSARKAALWIAGDSEYAMFFPSKPYSFIRYPLLFAKKKPVDRVQVSHEARFDYISRCGSCVYFFLSESHPYRNLAERVISGRYGFQVIA